MKIYVKNSNYVCRPEEDEYYLFYNKETGNTCIMNWSAYTVWSKCDGINTVSSIKEALVREYDIKPECMAAIEGIFELMEKKQLILLKQ